VGRDVRELRIERGRPVHELDAALVGHFTQPNRLSPPVGHASHSTMVERHDTRDARGEDCRYYDAPP